MIGVKFGTFDLQSGGITVTDTDIYSAPNNLVQSDKLANADGALVVNQLYDSKTFTMNGTITGTSIAAADALIDQFKIAMAVKNQTLDVDFNGGLRRYLATAQNVMISRPKGLTTAGFSVQFLSPDGMGWDLQSQSMYSGITVTTATANVSVTVNGSYNAEPLTRYTINTVTPGTTNTVTIANGTTLRGLRITRTWAAGDVVEIDSLKKTVFVNNSPADFNGQFPKWDVGAGIVSWTDDFTARNVTIGATYTARWL